VPGAFPALQASTNTASVKINAPPYQPKLHILKPPAFDLIDLLPALEREVLRLLIT
jgi:hypothetical protein